MPTPESPLIWRCANVKTWHRSPQQGALGQQLGRHSIQAVARFDRESLGQEQSELLEVCSYLTVYQYSHNKTPRQDIFSLVVHMERREKKKDSWRWDDSSSFVFRSDEELTLQTFRPSFFFLAEFHYPSSWQPGEANQVYRINRAFSLAVPNDVPHPAGDTQNNLTMPFPTWTLLNDFVTVHVDHTH